MTSREEAIKQLIKEQLRKAAFGLKGYKVFLFGSRRPIPLRTFYNIEDLLESIETLYSIVDMPDHLKRIEITANLFHFAAEDVQSYIIALHACIVGL